MDMYLNMRGCDMFLNACLAQVCPVNKHVYGARRRVHAGSSASVPRTTPLNQKFRAHKSQGSRLGQDILQ